MIDTDALRKKVINLAIQGKLTQQLPEDGNAEDLYAKIQEEKAKLINEGKIKKEKALPEITDDEIPFGIPQSWKWVRIADVGVTVTGNTPSKENKEYYGGDFRFYKPADLDAGRHINFGSETLSDSGKKEARYLNSGTILVCCIGTIGKAAIIDNDGACNQQINALSPIVCDSDYLLYAIESECFQKQLQMHSRATTVVIIKKSLFDECIVPLPPLVEQKRIVSIINNAFAQIDIIDSLQQLYESDREVLKGKIIEAGVQGKLTEQLPDDGDAEILYTHIQEEKAKLIKEGKIKKEKALPEITNDEIPFEIPSNWKWVRIGNVAEVAGGTTPKSTEVASHGTIPYFKVSDMNALGNETHMLQAKIFITNRYSGKIFPAGTTIFPKNGGAALTNKRRLLVFSSAVDLNTGGCTPIIPEMTDWIRLFMDTIDFAKIDTGSNIPTVNTTNLKQQLIPLPPLEEQSRIINRIQNIITLLK